jgi:soluble lytic murein transglycosylase-like protein
MSIEDMYNVMSRINEIKSRFGLNPKSKVTIPESGSNQNFGQMTDDAVSILNNDFGVYEEGSVSKTDIDKIVNYYSQKKGVPAPLVRSVIQAESEYNPEAISPKGAMGLMQLMPETAMGLGVENPFNPEENIKGGVTLLKNLLDNYKGNYKLALAAYNAGQGNVDKAGGIPNFKETKEYVKKVTDLYKEESGK